MVENRKEKTQSMGKLEVWSTQNPEECEVVDTSFFQEAEGSRFRDRLQQLSLQRGMLLEA